MSDVRDYLHGDDLWRYDRLSDEERAAFDTEFTKTWHYQAGEFAKARDALIDALGVHRFLSWLDQQLSRFGAWVKRKMDRP